MRTLDVRDAIEPKTAGARRRKPGSTLELTGPDSFIGDPVYNRKGELLGAVMEIMLDMESGKIAHAVISQGEAFFESGNMIALPWDVLLRGAGNHRFTLDVDKESFDAAAGFSYDNWPDMAGLNEAAQTLLNDTAEAA